VGIFDRYRHRLQRIPITYRIAIGNSAVIALGAIGGTLITRHLAEEAADWWLILFFIFIGMLLSVRSTAIIAPSFRARRLWRPAVNPADRKPCKTPIRISPQRPPELTSWPAGRRNQQSRA
jgi:uncharacterized membrane protein YfcA